jgi:DNA repair protein RAD57
LSSQVLYISTESALPVTRLSQLLHSHPILQYANPKPTLDRVHSIVTPDLESQDHILHFQVPVVVKQYGIRLIILDSVAANYRAEFERPGVGAGGQTSGANMGQRSAELVKLGQLLRNIAREHDVAIVVANQVADRFSSSGNRRILNRTMQSSPLAIRDGGASSSSMGPPMSSMFPTAELGHKNSFSTTPFTGTMDPMSLDHQQRWFTGWGDDPHPSQFTFSNMKTPSLGVIWTTQIACRIALIKRPVYGPGLVADEENERGEPVLRMWRRWMKIVFAPYAGPSGPGLEGTVEFEIHADGLKAVKRTPKDNDDHDDNETYS